MLTRIKWVISLLFILTAWSNTAVGQEKRVKTLGIGDAAPSIPVYKWILGNAINSFKKGQVYVVDFGATWCVPCAAAMPELTVIAQKYKESVTVAGIFVMEYNDNTTVNGDLAYVNRVEQYVAKNSRKIGYTVGVDGPKGEVESAWLKAAGRSGVPHIFVIDRNGMIAWVGSNPKVLDKILEQVLAKNYNLDQMIDSQIGSTVKSKIDNNSGNEVLYSSILSRYQGEQTGWINNTFIDNYNWAKDYPEWYSYRGMVKIVGQSLRRLYYMAYGDTLLNYPLSMIPGTGIYPDTIAKPNQKRSYGKYWYMPILELRDSAAFETNGDINRYNYSLKVPVVKATSSFLQKRMQDDLREYFGYDVIVEERLMPCWKLVVSPEAKGKLITKTHGSKYRVYQDDKGAVFFKNAQVRDLVFQLEIRYGYGADDALVYNQDKQPPFIDATGITEEIDYVFGSDAIKKITEETQGGAAFTFEHYKELLRTIGFDLVKSQKRMKVVVVRDRKM